MSRRSELLKLFGLQKYKKPNDNMQSLDTLRLQRYYDHSDKNDRFLDLYYDAVRTTASDDNFSKQNRFYTLYQMVGETLRRGVPGDFAECGCWHGHSTYMIAKMLTEAAWTNTFWVFDSFEGGLSDKVAEDRAGRAGKLTPEREREQKLKFVSSYDAVRETLSPYPFVSIQKGWIPQSFDVTGLAEQRFALVHVDVDLYEPTRDSLAFFAPRMSPGGIIVIDDYGSTAFPGSKRAVDELIAKTPHALFIESHLIGAVILF